MKIIFMGSPLFAVSSLTSLLKTQHTIDLVICQPDKPVGRGLKISSCPVATFARENKLELIQPKTLRETAPSPQPLTAAFPLPQGERENKEKNIFSKQLSTLKPDLIIVVAYGKFLPEKILKIPRLGCVNVHASLLPKYRGAAPINWAVVNGDSITGVTTMLINDKMDAGDILLQKETPIGEDETAATLYDRLANMGAKLLIDTISKLENGQIKRRPQDEKLATYAPSLKKTDGQINWNKKAKEIFNLIRGMQPWPVAYTHIDGKMLRVFRAREAAQKTDAKPGTIITTGKELAVATGEGILYLLEVQLEGKKRMPIHDFLMGYKVNSQSLLVDHKI